MFFIGSSRFLPHRLGVLFVRSRRVHGSAYWLNLYQSRDVPTEPRKVFFIDTHAYIKELEKNGFSQTQAEIIVAILNRVCTSSVDELRKEMVTKTQQEILMQQLMAHVNSLKKDMVILEKSEFSALRNENEKLSMEMAALRKLIGDELFKTKSGLVLDMNLEKSRVKEAHAEAEKGISKLHNKIEMEIANLRTVFESYKTDQIKYIAGTILTSLMVVLAFYRLMKD